MLFDAADKHKRTVTDWRQNKRSVNLQSVCVITKQIIPNFLIQLVFMA